MATAAYPCRVSNNSAVVLSSNRLARLQCQQLQKRAAFSVRKCSQRLVTVAYMEQPVSQTNKILGALPFVGLAMRILSEEGGIGGDRLDYVHFATRVDKKCPPDSTEAFHEFKERHGELGSARTLVLFFWLAAVGGSGLVSKEEMREAACRVRVTGDIVYEVELFREVMADAEKELQKAKIATPPPVPLIDRVELALDLILTCCLGRRLMDEEDAGLLLRILHGVFPSVEKRDLAALVACRLMDPNKPEEAEWEPVTIVD